MGKPALHVRASAQLPRKPLDAWYRSGIHVPMSVFVDLRPGTRSSFKSRLCAPHVDAKTSSVAGTCGMTCCNLCRSIRDVRVRMHIEDALSLGQGKHLPPKGGKGGFK